MSFDRRIRPWLRPGAQKQYLGGKFCPYFGDLSIALKDTLIQGMSESTSVEADRVYEHYSSPVIAREGQLSVTWPDCNPTSVKYYSSDPSIADIDADGYITYVSDGQCDIVVIGYAGRWIDVDTPKPEAIMVLPFVSTLTGGDIATEFSEFTAGSVARVCAHAIDTRLLGKDPLVSKPLYLQQDHAGKAYVRNPDFWGSDLDLSAISPYNSTGLNCRAGTAISPLHIIFATHYQISVGATVRFVSMDGNVYDRTLIDKISLTKESAYYPDLTIGILDSALPDDIHPIKILPSNIDDYWTDNGQFVPVFQLDQEEKGLVADLSGEGNYSSFVRSTDSLRTSFSESIISGDSGNPVFVIINDMLVLLTVFTYGGAGSGTSIRYFQAEVQTAMDSLSHINGLSQHNLSVIDLSAYPTY